MSPHKCPKYSLALLAITLIMSGPVFKYRPRPLSLFSPALAETMAAEPGFGNASELSAGKSVARELSPSQKHSFQVTLDAGQYLHLVIEQQGIDATVKLYEPGGQMLIQFGCRHDGPTPLSLIAETSGCYRLEVSSLEMQQTRGHYQLKVEEIRQVTAKDKHRVAAERAFAEGEQRLKEWRAESSRMAIDKFKDSLPSWRAAGDRREEALSLRRIGGVHRLLGEYQDALAFYNEALSISRETKDRWGEGETLNEISYIYISLGKNQKALKYCTRALKLSQATGDRRGEAQALNNFGEVYNWSGKLQKALDFYRQALSLWTDLGDHQGQAQTHTYLGYTYSDLGQMREAFGFYNQALSHWQSAQDRLGEAITLTAMGRLYSRIGESQEALDFFERAMQLIQPMGDPIEEGRIFTGMAYVYGGFGEKNMALEYYKRAASRFRVAKYSRGEAEALVGAGRIYHSLGDNQQALEYHQHALSIFKTLGDRKLESFELGEIGKVYDSLGNKTKALEDYLSACSFYRAERVFRGQADALNLIGRIYEGWGQRQRALDYYEKALPLSQKAEYRVGQASTLYNIARVERDRGNLAEGRARIKAALGVVESLRTKVSSQDLRASYFATVRQHYELYIDILMQLHKQRPTEGFDVAAFDVSEKARARSLLESLKEARADIRQGADPSLLERERSLEQALNAKAERRMQLVASKNGAEAQTVAKEIDQLTTEYDEVKTQIKSTSPHYAALTQPQPLSLRQIQQQVLDDNSLLLEYVLGDDRSYVWAVTQTEISSFELPDRAQIEDAARRFYSLLTASMPRPDETFAQRQQRVEEASAQLPNETDSLSRLLLGSVASKLGSKRLLIVADGALQYIPFQALTVRANANRSHDLNQLDANAKADSQVPLILDHEIINEPSASTLGLVLSETTNRKTAPNTVAILADPVFEADDPRVGSSKGEMQAAPTLSPSEVKQAFRDVSLDAVKIPRLLASREEAEGIMALIPWGTGLKAVGFDASRATITRADLGQYRIVHFATHGVLDNERPELSGIVLSLVDQQGQSQDGFLRLHDIYNLNLSADLVVLSACNTGLGKDVKGEGLIGLTRGFMYAGAAGVVASLWKVDDDATSELMNHFYEAMFKRGMSPSAALRESQLAMWRQKRWHAPYYWAAFVIQGQYNDTESMSGPSLHARKWITALAVMASALLLVAFFSLRRRRRRII